MIDRSYFQRRVHLRRSSSTNQKRYIQSGFLQFDSYMGHFLQRRSNQTTKTYHVYFFLNSALNDSLCGNHYSQVDNLIAIASHYHGNNILTDIVYITFHCGKQYLSGRSHSFYFFRLDNRLQNSNSLLHCTGSLHHLRQEHLSCTEKLAYIIHSVHQRTFNHIDCFIIEWQCFCQVLFEIISDTFHQSIFQTFLNGFIPPCIMLHSLLSGSFARSCL